MLARSAQFQDRLAQVMTRLTFVSLEERVGDVDPITGQKPIEDLGALGRENLLLHPGVFRTDLGLVCPEPGQGLPMRAM